ncbi:hypothetical protein KM427_16400 [Nocardioides sp. LMS-CY]|uniref:Uncharacterized protein n=1 Tax=Nocardioides soli TaxID=1036020 RepID=A0A7W4VYP6_9ACTN|nr:MULTISPECIES: hypothetical protein [Nocardioides]MBB3044155.1 hypothetical protein [Nocardioides soli]QWF20559.1 hypothetical protein KM427_16400 [Nocardioides sp. LMS-CY]
MNLTPAQTAKLVGGVTVGAIILVLIVFLVITWINGDPTNDLKEHQPSPSPSSARTLP